MKKKSPLKKEEILTDKRSFCKKKHRFIQMIANKKRFSQIRKIQKNFHSKKRFSQIRKVKKDSHKKRFSQTIG